jgi:hypothetical protein
MSSVKELLRGDVIDGSGTANYIPKFIDTNTIGNSAITDDGSTITLSTSSTERMRIDSSGNVGIGTSSPAHKLHLSATTTDIAQFQGSSKSMYLYQDVGGLGWATGTSFSGSGMYFGDTNGTIQYNTSGSEKMRITSGGQLLVNTTSSLYSLVRLSVKQTTGDRTMEVWSAWSGDQGTEALNITKYDNVSTTSQVFQRFVINNGDTNSGQINANGASQAAFGSYSDIRLKENIEDLPNQLNKINSLRPVEFDYLDGSGHQIGFIAQEMQEVYPDAVGEDENGMLSITGWAKTEARLVKAIQEQQDMINELRAEVESLKSQING